MRTKGIIRFFSIESDLNEREIDRLQSAARYVGIPWTPIVSRPAIAREFIRRIERQQSKAY